MVQDHAEAARWYRKAAYQGYAPAQFQIGVAYYLGRGVVQNYVKAHMWMNLAAARANGDDQKRYADLRAEVVGKMTAPQIEEAQRLAQEWKPITAK